MTEPTVIAERRAHLGILTLNRPAALNALSLEMVRLTSAQLCAWRQDPDVGAVVLRGTNREGKPAAFCAGGDVRSLHAAALAGDPLLDAFFVEEYALDHLIHHFGKPTFALMDGVTMGGGMGLAQGASMRVVTERSQLAMPETRIGLFPDVGGGWFLGRCPGRLGEFLGLTGWTLGAADSLAVDWADICIASDRLDGFVQGLADATHRDGVGALSAANAFATSTGTASLGTERDLIERVFAAPTVAAIMDALAAESGDFAVAVRQTLAKRSPLMMSVTLEQVRRARSMTLAEDLRMELGMMHHCFHGRPGAAEALEGIRAQVIDRDQAPRWHPADIARVDCAEVLAFFVDPWSSQSHPLSGLA